MIRLVVFDLDGTLVDSRRDIAEATNATLESFGAARLPDQAVGRMVGDGAPVLVARAFEAVGVDQPENALERFLAIYHGRLLEHTRPYDGIPDVLTALMPRVALGVLTNKPIAATRAILDGLDLSRFFPDRSIIGGDGPFARKPDPSGLRHLVAVSETTPDATLLVGDSAVDWRTSRAASTQLCLARYGFGWESLTAVDPVERDLWVIDRPIDLLERL